MQRSVLLSSVLLCLLASCTKLEESGTGDPNDPRLNRPYCPVPEAVNYNWNFPGQPDSSTCFYPTDVFAGTYLYVDTFFREDNTLAGSDTFLIQLFPLSRTRLWLTGLCASGDSILLTANRYLRADIDSNTELGRRLCRPEDTAAGFINRSLADSTRVNFSFVVRADTGITQHYGTAIRQ